MKFSMPSTAMSGSIHVRPVQEPVVVPRGSSVSSLKELNSAWESVDRAKHALERAEARLQEAEGPYGVLSAIDSSTMTDRSDTRITVDRVPKWRLHSPPPTQNSVTERYNGRSKNKRVTIQEGSPIPGRDWLKLGSYRSPCSSPTGGRSPTGDRSFSHQNNSGSANQSFTTVQTPTEMQYLNEPVPPHSVGYQSTYEKLYGPRKNELVTDVRDIQNTRDFQNTTRGIRNSRDGQNGSINAEYGLEKLRSRIQEQKQELLNGSRTKEYNYPRHYHRDTDPVLTSDNYSYDWPKEAKLTRKVAVAPAPKAYKGFSLVGSRYGLPDGRPGSSRNKSPDRKRTMKTTKTSGTNNKAITEKHKNPSEHRDVCIRSDMPGGIVRKRAHGDPKKASRKTVRKVHSLKGDSKLSKPEKLGNVTVNAWRDSHKTAMKILGPAPKLRKVSTPQPNTDSKYSDVETHDDDIEDAEISDHPLESDEDRDQLKIADTALRLPENAKDVLKDLHLQSDEEENIKSNDSKKDEISHSTQPPKKCRKSRKSKASQNSKQTDPYNVPKVRSYDTNEVRQYMAKQKAERKKREKEEKEQKNLAEKKKQEQLDAIYRKQHESFKTKPSSGRVLQPRLDQTFLKETKPSNTQIVAEMSGSDKENKHAWSPSSSSDTQQSFTGISNRFDMLGVVTNDDLKHQEQPSTTSRPTSLLMLNEDKPLVTSHTVPTSIGASVASYPHNERTKPASRSMRIESLRATAAALQGRLEKETHRFTSQWNTTNVSKNPKVTEPSARWAYSINSANYPADPSLAYNIDSLKKDTSSYGANPTHDWRSVVKPVTASCSASRKLDFNDDTSHRNIYDDGKMSSSYLHTISGTQPNDKRFTGTTSYDDVITRHEKIVGNRYRSEFSGDLPGISSLTVGAKKAEQFSLRTDAATRIQATYRGHSVRQKLGSWLSDKKSDDFKVEDIGLDDEDDRDEPSEYQDLPNANICSSSHPRIEKAKDRTPVKSPLNEYRSWESHHSGLRQPESCKSISYSGEKSPDKRYHSYTARPSTLGYSALNIPDDGHSVIDIYTRRLKSFTQNSSKPLLKSPIYEDDYRKLPSKSPVYEDDFTSESLSHESLSHDFRPLNREKSNGNGSPLPKATHSKSMASPGTRTESQISDSFSGPYNLVPKPISNGASYVSTFQSTGSDAALVGSLSDEKYCSPVSSKGSPASTLSRTSRSSPHSSAGSSPRLPDQHIDPIITERPQPRGQAADNKPPSRQPPGSSDHSYQQKSLSGAAGKEKSDPVQSLLIGGEAVGNRVPSEATIDQTNPRSYQPRVTQEELSNRLWDQQFDRRYPSAFVPNQQYFSPSALEIKMAAELNRLDTVEESYRRLTELEKTRAVSLAQQESVSIAQILKTRQQGHERELQILSSKARQEVDDAQRQLEQLKQQARETALAAEKTLAQTKKEATDSKVLESQAEVAKATAEAAKQLAQARQANFDHSTNIRDYEMGQMATQTASAAAAAAVTAAMEQQRTQQEMWLDQIKSTLRENKSAKSPTSETNRHKVSSDYSEEFTSGASAKESYKSRDSISPSPSKTSATSSISSRLASTQSESAAVKSNSSGEISEDLPTVKSPSSSSIVTDPSLAAKGQSIQEDAPETYTEDFNRTTSEVDTLEDDQSYKDVTEIKSDKDVATTNEKRKSPTTPKQSPARESLNKLSSKFLSQQLKDEEFRAQQQLDLLRLREKAIKEKTRAEMAWLEHQKKKHLENEDEEGVAAVKKKQRSLNSRLQTELSDIKRLQKAQEIAQKDRQLLIYQQQELLRIRQSTEEFKGRMGDISISSMSEMSSHDALVVDDDVSDMPLDSSFGLESSALSSPGGENEDREMAAHKQAKVLQKLKLMQAPLNSRHLMKRQQKLSRRRKTAEELLAWKQKLDEEEAKVVRIEKQALNLLEGDGIGSSKTKKDKSPVLKHADAPSRSTSRESDATIEEAVEEDKAGESSIAEEISQASSIAEDIASNHGASKRSGNESSVPSEMSVDDALYRSADYSQDQFDTASADASITPKSNTRKGVIKSPIGSLMSLESLRSPVAPWKRRESESGSESERSFSQTMSETASDQSDVEGRLRALNDQLKRRKSEAERLRKQQKRIYREKLKVQEASLRKQLEAYEKFIEKTKKELSADAELAKGAVKPQIKQPGQGKDRTLPGLTRQRTKSESSRESIPLDTTPTRLGRESESSHSSLEEDTSPNPSVTPSSTASYRGFGLTFTPSPKPDDYIIKPKTQPSPSGIQKNEEPIKEPVTQINEVDDDTVLKDRESDGDIEEDILEEISSQASDAVVISTGGLKEKDEIQELPVREDSIKDESLMSEDENESISAVSELHKLLSANSSKRLSATSHKSLSIDSSKSVDYTEEFESEIKTAATEEDISEHLSFASDVEEEDSESLKQIVVSPKDDKPKELTTDISERPDLTPQKQLSESEKSVSEEVQSEASEKTVTGDQQKHEVKSPVVGIIEPKAPLLDSGILEEAELSRADTTESNSRLDNLQDNTEDENSIAEEFSGPMTDDAALDMIIRSAASAVESFNFDDEEGSENDVFSPKNDQVFNVDDTPRTVEDIPRDDVVVVAGGFEAVVEKITDNFTKSLVDNSRERIADVLKCDEDEIPETDDFSEVKEEFDREIELELEKKADNKSEFIVQNLIGDAIGTMIAIRKKRDTKIIEQSIKAHSQNDIMDEDMEQAKVIDVSLGEFPDEEEENLNNEERIAEEDEKLNLKLKGVFLPENEESVKDKDPISSILALPPLSPTKSLTSDQKDVDHDVFVPPDSPKIDDSRSSSPDISDRMEQMQLLDQQLMDRDIFGEQEWFDDDFSSMPKTKSLVEVPKRNKDDHKKQEATSTIELSKLKEIQKITEELYFAVPHNKEDVGTMVSKSLDELKQKRALEKSLVDVSPSESILGNDTKDSDIESASKKSYKTLIFDLSNEVYQEVLSEQTAVTYPPWIKQKRKPRKYVVDKRTSVEEHDELLGDMINNHIKLLLGLEKKKKSDAFSLKYSKKKKDHVDEILIQELREEEPEWVNYDDDEVTVKMQLADGIMESLLTETAMVLTHISDKRKLREQKS